LSPLCRSSLPLLLRTCTARSEIYTLSLHDALPIYTTFSARSGSSVSCFYGIVSSVPGQSCLLLLTLMVSKTLSLCRALQTSSLRSEEHTSELQSRENLVCRLLLEKKKTKRRRGLVL